MDYTYYVKILNNDLVHYGFQYVEGLNVDTKKFNPIGSGMPGGLYFTKLEYIGDCYISAGAKIANVEIPKDAKMYIDPEGNKWKSDKIIVSNIINIGEHKCWYDTELCLIAVTKNGMLLEYVKNPTHEICLAAVKQTGYSLKYVEYQTEEICLAAVNQIGCALKYVKNQTEEICIAAIEQNINASEYVKL